MTLVLRKVIVETKRNLCKSSPSVLDKAQAKPPKQSDLVEIKEKGPVFVAAHVGAGFCRAAAICSKGSVLKWAQAPCQIHQQGIFSEMSSENTWASLVKCIRTVTEKIDNANYKGIGFTATPALVCLDDTGNPVTASVSRDKTINVILHYDNRSTREAQKINKTRHAFLQYFGEKVLPELQESKLMWLKNNLKEDCWAKAGHFFELTDFLTWKATGSLVRSSSCLNSQWSYQMAVNGKEGWDAGCLTEIGLPELVENDFKRIGTKVLRPGTPLATGLLQNEAGAMGLPSGLPVAIGMPDSLTGCLGIIGCKAKDVAEDISNRLYVVFNEGTASHFALSRDPHFIKAVKGPLRDGVVPNMWLNHAEQTTAESVLEYIIDSHPAMPNIRKQIGPMHIHKYLNKILKLHVQKLKLKSKCYLTNYLHVLPDFNGNISPLGDPFVRGMISGLTLTSNQKSLAILYLATMQSLAYCSQHVMSSLVQNGHDLRCILIGGSLGQNSVLVQLYKDIFQLPIVIPNEPNSTLIGAAILGGVASNHFRDFSHAIEEMGGSGVVEVPNRDPELLKYHEKKYEVFLKMYDHQREYRRVMGEIGEEHARADVEKH